MITLRKIQKKQNNKSVQNWIGINKLLDDGVMELLDGSFIKILKVEPINFLMKTDFEKESILQAYKTFFKTCNFDIQILIQSKRENLSKNIQLINEKIKIEKNEKINKIRKNYIKYIENNNLNSDSISKNYFIIIKKEKIEIKDEEIIKEELNDKFLKIKETLKRCGNEVDVITNEENKEIIYSFFNTRKFLNKII